MSLDRASITDAYDTLHEDARKRWLFGKPTPADLRALRKRVADRLRIDVTEVEAALRERGDAEETVNA